jgi:hypothetical protein
MSTSNTLTYFRAAWVNLQPRRERIANSWIRNEKPLGMAADFLAGAREKKPIIGTQRKRTMDCTPKNKPSCLHVRGIR